LQDVQQGVSITIFSDNVGNKLHASDYTDFQTEFPEIPIRFKTIGNVIHDRYIVLDFDTENERVYHCGASSKDAGKKLTSITEYRDEAIKFAFHEIVEDLLKNPELVLK
jgi:hypothetical protein